MADPRAEAVNSTIIMKVDSPKEENDEKTDSVKEETAATDIVEINESQICSPAVPINVLSSPRLSPSNPFASKSSLAINKSVLRPSILASNVNNATANAKTMFALNPSRLSTFVKNSNEDGKDNCDKDNNDATVEQKNLTSSNGDSLKFVPLIQEEKKANENIVKPITSGLASVQTNPTFVFGQNLQDRVISDKSSEEPKPSTSLTSNGTSEMLFSSAMKDKIKPDLDMNKETKSLSESAREYEESRANKRKYEEVETRTGEEGETNVMHLSCKLFAFDKASGTWQERGRGNLRLNDLLVENGDKAYTQSRLVFRTSGSLRVILNTKIWAEMTVDQASAKSIRFTAIDSNGDIKVYLVMANPEEIKSLYKHLEQRVQSENERQKHKKVSLETSNSSVN